MNAFQLPEFLKTLLSALPATPPSRADEPPHTDDVPPPATTETPPPEERENRFLTLLERHEKAVKKIGQGNKKP